ncbi:NAD(P)-binding domain-containing protein [Streptomyces sp. NPDC045369]|uniref:NAD(P)-binding domain-containing protein n=1 Tax=Streptomyces sp. NPDC045369 TaxID=3155732 RepID=UPI0033FE2A13
MGTIGCIGLGIMGSPMAVNLAKAGHTVAGWNRSSRRRLSARPGCARRSGGRRRGG